MDSDERVQHPSISKYLENYGRMRDLLEIIELPARGRRGSRANQKRSRIVQAALHQLKVAGAGLCEIRRSRGRCSLCKVAVPFRQTRSAQ
jgi:hypothetical protein